MARIIVKERGFETLNVAVTTGKITAGRSHENTIHLRNRYASGHHCDIVLEEDGARWKRIVDFDYLAPLGAFVLLAWLQVLRYWIKAKLGTS